MFRFAIKARHLVLVCALYISTVLNLAFWQTIYANLALTGIGPVIFAFSLFLALFFLSYVLFSIVGTRFIFKPFAIAILLLAAVLNYFMVTYGVLIDKEMVRNAVQTDVAEVRDLVSLPAVLWVGLTGGLPALLIGLVSIDYAPLGREVAGRLKVISACLVLVLICVGITFKDYAVFGRNNKKSLKLLNPYSAFWSAGQIIKGQASVSRQFTVLDPNAELAPFPDTYPTVFVFVVGETARAANFGLDGYERPTTPRLGALDIVNFRDTTAAGTSTAFSVPSMFSSEDRSGFSPDTARYTENLLDLLQKSGYRVLWLENNSGCKGVCDRVPTVDVTALNDPAFCDGSTCHDGLLLKSLEEALATVTDDTFIVLHLIGSHGPAYYKRYPEAFRFFEPTCDTAEIQTCSRDEVVNSYDNSMRYTDMIVAEAIGALAKYPNFESGLLYVSDHGESLGENGVYLHSLPYGIAPDTQKKVPMILWLSEVMQSADHLDYACLKEKAGLGVFSHDNLFHSMVGLMEVNSKLYQQEQDIFQSCRLKQLPWKAQKDD